MANVALAEKPFKIAVGRASHTRRAQRRLFDSVTLGAGLVALLAMFMVEKGAGGQSVMVTGKRILPLMVAGRDCVPVRS